MKVTANAKDSLKLQLFIQETFINVYEKAFRVHHTNELPMMLNIEDVFEIKGGKLIEAFITASVTTIDEDLAVLDINDRSCYMDEERHLKFFKAYTKRNCEIECFSNFSKEVCNCVPYDVVRDQKTKVCGIDEYECVRKLKSDFVLFKTDDQLESCNCLETCDLITYDVVYFDSTSSEP